MPQHQGYSVTITSGGRELPAYNVNVVDNNITSYVESVQGQEFSINFADYSRSRMRIQVKCLLDGECITTKTCTPSRPTLHIWGVRKSMSSKATLKFSDVNFVEDDEANGRIGASIGAIELKLYRVRPLHVHTGRKSYSQLPVTLDSGPVSEKNKKAGWHQVALGPERSSVWTPSKIKYTRLDPSELPYMTFRFYYRPRAILQAEGFLQPANNPQASGDTKPSVKALRSKMSHGKPTKQEDSTPTISKYDPNEVIDLDDSDDEGHRRRSPIRVGAGAGETIDLTLED
ncbi:hypothetical protein OF83DRAFT_1167307 [Amylostereum chailletii]|nr:hypothetical protein OF83DRAFT_1167307 [Amylostereum chailletii]